MHSISKEDITAILDFNPEDGSFSWKHDARKPNKWNARFAGKRAGCKKCDDGYSRIRIGKKLFMEHRLVMLMTTGEMPECEVDHIDGDRSNNKPSNLRLATRQQNSANTGLRHSNTTGVKGVIFRDRPKPWYARIVVNRKTIVIGSFKTKKEAQDAYNFAALMAFGEYTSAVSRAA